MSAYWMPAYVALGSNLDEPPRQVRAALDRLTGLRSSMLITASRLYRSEPLGPQDQPQFVNAVGAMLTRLSPRDLFIELKEIERQMGRETPIVRWGPRRIDLDLLVYGNRRIDDADLRVPHPGVPERNFVLYPLYEIAPQLEVPGYGTVAALVAKQSDAGLAVLA